MSILNFFARNPKTTDKPDLTADSPAVGACSLEPMPITATILRQLFPIRNLSPEELQAFATQRWAETATAGSFLFHAGKPADAVFYLLAGRVCIQAAGLDHEIDATETQARFPLCASNKLYKVSARTLTDVQYLRVPGQIMDRCSHLEERKASRSNPLPSIKQNQDLPEQVRNSRLFQDFCEHFRIDDPRIPTLPDVAIQLRKAVEKNSDIREIAHIVQMDPGIAAKIISVANSPLYSAAKPIETCQDAILRLGLVAVRSLVMALSVRSLFQGGNSQVTKLLREQWEQSLYRSTLCHVLASHTLSISPEQALLAGLFSDIGVVPFLYFADSYPGQGIQPGEIEAILPHVRGPLGTFLLAKWGVPEEFVPIPVLSEQWLYTEGEKLTLADIVILAKLHTYIGTPMQAQLPHIDSIPAYSKLTDSRLSPSMSLQFLHEARDRVREAVQIMRA